MRTETTGRMVQYDERAGQIQHMGAATDEPWADVVAEVEANDGCVERVSDLSGWAPYTALYRVAWPIGGGYDEQYYAVGGAS